MYVCRTVHVRCMICRHGLWFEIASGLGLGVHSGFLERLGLPASLNIKASPTNKTPKPTKPIISEILIDTQ